MLILGFLEKSEEECVVRGRLDIFDINRFGSA